mmetsp:Transcript_47282/g.122218  ORF Transcript_47282/g.122218 Transcript_47282/m.122218 type:complete len:271 (-) Transcript_47282:1324-2136(-)
MVAGEGVEGSNLLPPAAKLGVAVAIETADIRSNQRNAEDVHREDARNGHLEVEPLGIVVTQPVSTKNTATGKCGSADAESTLLAESLKSLGGDVLLRVSIQVVQVVVNVGVLHGIHCNRLQAEGVLGGIVVARYEGGVVCIERGTIANGIGRNGLRFYATERSTSVEVARLVHVDPHTIEGNLIVPVRQVGLPPRMSSGVEKIGESGGTRPDAAIENVPLRIHDEHTILDTIVERSIGSRSQIVFNCRIKHHDVLLAVVVQVFNKGLEIR